MNRQQQVSLAPFTSLRVGGRADHFVHSGSFAELAAGLAWAAGEGQTVRLIGGGSNLLVADLGVDGLVIRCGQAEYRVEHDEHGPVLVAGAGVTLANVARRLAKQGYGGLEWAANVPGTVGGAVVNNAGAFGGDLASCLVTATLADPSGAERRVDAAELGYAYRSSVLKRGELGLVAVTQATIRLTVSTVEAADGLVRQYNEQRMRSQPRLSSAGSVFANPAGQYSGKLIEDAGLKGHRVGGAAISEQHANFIVNLGGATADDVYTLMRQTQDVVYGATGTWLRPEIELLGRWTDEQKLALAGPARVVMMGAHG